MLLQNTISFHFFFSVIMLVRLHLLSSLEKLDMSSLIFIYNPSWPSHLMNKKAYVKEKHIVNAQYEAILVFPWLRYLLPGSFTVVYLLWDP